LRRHDGGDDDDGGGGSGDPEGEDECTQIEPIELETGVPADVFLVVDKSGSMRDPLEDGNQKWASMRGALTQVVGEYDGAIHFGLMLYPRGDDCSADAGGTGQYFAANSTAELQAALDAIAVLVGQPSCTFPLDREPGELTSVTVYHDDTVVPHDPAQGWEYDGASNSITFFGVSCDDIRQGETDRVRIEFDCDGDSCLEPDGCGDGDGPGVVE
jgi:hypothetical protein